MEYLHVFLLVLWSLGCNGNLTGVGIRGLHTMISKFAEQPQRTEFSKWRWFSYLMMQVYSNLPGGKSHIVNTSWAMLTLMAAGQVRGRLKLILLDANSYPSLPTSKCFVGCKNWFICLDFLIWRLSASAFVIWSTETFQISVDLLVPTEWFRLLLTLFSFFWLNSGSEILNHCIEQPHHSLMSKRSLEIFPNRYWNASREWDWR